MYHMTNPMRRVGMARKRDTNTLLRLGTLTAINMDQDRAFNMVHQGPGKPDPTRGCHIS
jgi:hypothetical protein